MYFYEWLGEQVTVIDKRGKPNETDDYYQRSLCVGHEDKVFFTLQSAVAVLSFQDSEIRHIRLRALSFVHLQQGSLEFQRASITGLDFSSSGAFVLQTGSAPCSVLFEDCTVSGLNGDHPYTPDYTYDSGLILAAALQRLTLSRSTFEDNQLISGDNYEGVTHLVSASQVASLEIISTSFLRSMGGVFIQLQSLGSLTRLSNLEFAYCYSIGNPILWISAIAPMHLELLSLRFYQNSSEGSQELLRVVMVTSPVNSLLLQRGVFQYNGSGGGRLGMFLFKGLSNLSMEDCEFSDNGSYDAEFSGNIFSSLVAEGRLNDSEALRTRKIDFSSSCDAALNFVNVQGLNIQRSSFASAAVQCWYLLQVVDPVLDAKALIATVSQCYFTSETGYGVAVRISNDIPKCVVRFHNCAFDRVTWGSIYFETYQLHAAGVLAQDSTWRDCGNFVGNQGDIELYGGGYLQLSNCSFVNSRGSRSGAFYAFQLSTNQGDDDRSQDATLIVENCVFESNVSPLLGGDFFYATPSGTSPLTVRIVNSRFHGGSSTTGGGSFVIRNTRIASGLIANSSFQGIVSKQGGAVSLEHIEGAILLENLLFTRFRDQRASCIYVKTPSSPVETIMRRLKFQSNSVKAAVWIGSEAGSPTVRITANEYRNNTGVAVWNEQGSLSDTDSVYEDNANDLNPAYFQTEYSSGTFLRARFAGNQAREQAGAVYIRGPGSAVNFSQCVFTRNQSWKLTGVIHVEKSCLVRIADSEFSHNSAPSVGVLGLQNVDQAVLVVNCSFVNNTGEAAVQIDSSSLILSRVQFHSNNALGVTGGFLLMKANLSVFDSDFADMAGEKGCFAYGFVSSRVEFIRSTLRSVTCDGEVVLLTSSSYLNLTSSDLTDISVGASSVISLTSQGAMSLVDSRVARVTVLDVPLNSDFGMLFAKEVEVTVSNCSFQDLDVVVLSFVRVARAVLSSVSAHNITAERSTSGVLLCWGCADLTLRDSQFHTVSSSIASAVYIDTETGQIGAATIANTEFHSMRSAQHGVIAVQASTITVTNCSFLSNDAYAQGSSGGGVYFHCDCSAAIVASAFRSNSATYGGAVYWDLHPIDITNVTFDGNVASFGPNAASRPVCLVLLSDEYPREAASGQGYSGVISVGVVDYYGQVLNVDSESDVWISSAQRNVSLQGATKAHATNGTFSLTDFVVLGKPGTDITLAITSTALDQSYVTTLKNSTLAVSLKVGIRLRYCAAGEIQSETACTVCNADTYSLDVGAEMCRACLPQAICLGGLKMYPRPGYWRPDPMFEGFFDCPRKASCLGSANHTSLEGVCEVGYSGNLCQSCVAGYSRSNRDTCSVCPATATNSLRISMVCVGFIMFIIYAIRSAFVSAAKEMNLQGVYMKILMNYLQSVVLTASFSLNWPQLVIEMFEIQNLFGQADEQILSFDCFSQDSSFPVVFQKLLLVAALPTAILVLSGVYWSLFLKRESFVSLRDKYATTVIIILFMLYPTIVKTVFATFNCRLVRDGEWWMREDLKIRCWEALHMKIALGAALPSLLLWCAGIPAVAGLLLRRQRRELKRPSVRAQFGFLYIGYSEKAYFWEFLVLWRKVTVVGIYVFMSPVAPAIQGLLVFSLLTVTLALQLKWKPFLTPDLNTLEVRNILVCEVTIYCGLFFLSDQLNQSGEFFMFMIMVVVNTYFLVYWVYCYVQVLMLPAARKSPHFFLKWCRCLPRVWQAAFDSLKAIEEEQLPTLSDGAAQVVSVGSMHGLYMRKVQMELASRGVTQREDADEVPPSTPLHGFSLFP